MRNEASADRQTTHGMTDSSEYKIWVGMIQRCTNPNHKSYEKYGRRGIKVCDRWRQSFMNFFEDMGPRPSLEHSLDRRDNDSGYQPDNCRWATVDEQARNNSRNRILKFDGKSLCVSDWAYETGIPYSTILGRLDRGCSVEEALAT